MYESFYGLDAKPFRLTPDPRFLYVSASHKKALSYLRYGIYRAEGFIVVVGAPGTGKTTVINSVLAELPGDEIIVSKLVTTQLGADDILRAVAATLGINYEGLSKAGLLNNLESYFKEQFHQGRRVLVLIDEAQHLSRDGLEELRMLTNFQENDQALMQCFLIGQEELKTMIDAPNMEQLRQRVIASCYLRPLSGAETVSYIEHRLTQAGWRGEAIFTFGAYELIHRQTEGNPRLINSLCERVLLHGYLENCREIDENVVLTVIEEVASEVGGRDALEGVHETREAIRQVRRSLKVVDSQGASAPLTQEEEAGSAESFRFQTVDEPDRVEEVTSRAFDEDSVVSPPSVTTSSVVDDSVVDAPQASSSSASPASRQSSPEMEAHEPEPEEESTTHYVEAAIASIERKKEEEAAQRGDPDPTPYFGAHKSYARIPVADEVSPPPEVGSRQVDYRPPGFMDKLKKQLPNIGIIAFLLAMMAMIFFPEPEKPEVATPEAGVGSDHVAPPALEVPDLQAPAPDNAKTDDAAKVEPGKGGDDGAPAQ